MIYDKEFLLRLDKTKNKTIYARITSLTFDERPVEMIEGRITQGSINVDGSSAVRRTCSLTMIAQNFNYENQYSSIFNSSINILNTKFKLEVGVANFIDPSYPDIIWFKQGIYLFTSFNTSRSANNFTITLQGKDKMCLLNGDIGGSLESSIDFGKIEEESEEGIWTIKQIPIYEIIRNAVHVYAGEPYHNIIINDLDSYGLELLEYRYDIPLYLYRKWDSEIFANVLLNGKTECWLESDSSTSPARYLEDLTINELDILVDSLMGTSTPKKVRFTKSKTEAEYYYIAKVEYGQTAGYRMTDLTFAGDLIANVGETIVSVLDKIKNMLSEFEYFYDLDGQFVFQRKQSFVNTLWSPIQSADTSYLDDDNNSLYLSEKYIESLALQSSVAYVFNEGELITAFNNNPNILNMRNDFSVWGMRKTTSGADVPVHMRYAIDKKPTHYKTFDRYEKKLYTQNNFKPSQEDIYTKDNNSYQKVSSTAPFNEEETYYIKVPSKTYLDTEYDWREIIYQMAVDYYKHNTEDDFELNIRNNNIEYYPSGRTGYEKYYIDIYSFWRDLYNPDAALKKSSVSNTLSEKKQSLENLINNTTDGLAITQARIKVAEEDLITLSNTFSKLDEKDDNYESTKAEIEEKEEIIKGLKENESACLDSKASYEKEISELENEYEKLEGYYDSGDRIYWHRDVYEYPHTLNFWFDFLDTEGELSQFNVQNMGSRSKAINDTAVKSIYFREIPDVVFISNSNDVKTFNTAFKYIQVNDMENMFSISAQGKSAKERIDELLYQHGYCIENVTITTIPIYYLQPNTRIYIHDQATNINGEYIVSKITIPLAYNGTMSITATKAAENII